MAVLRAFNVNKVGKVKDQFMNWIFSSNKGCRKRISAIGTLDKLTLLFSLSQTIPIQHNVFVTCLCVCVCVGNN